MIIERAALAITPGREADFETAFAQARQVVAEADGFRSLRIARGIESPSTYLLLIEWDTVEAHMIGFRESDRFVRWRELIGPYFAAPPAVEHFEPID
ncbi:MAG: antibiotic biosynthesis monooxygenase [Solirubrobacteraceae bacterium]